MQRSMSPARTWEDDHDGYTGTTTKKDGSYEIGAGSLYVLRLDAEAAGFENAEESEEEGDFYSPGRYDFTLLRK